MVCRGEDVGRVCDGVSGGTWMGCVMVFRGDMDGVCDSVLGGGRT